MRFSLLALAAAFIGLAPTTAAVVNEYGVACKPCADDTDLSAPCRIKVQVNLYASKTGKLTLCSEIPEEGFFC